MKIVLDVCVPQPFRHELPGHEMATTRYLGQSRLADNDLIAAIEPDWNVLLNTDRGIPWQNAFAGRDLARIIMGARTNKLQVLVALVPRLLVALNEIQPGQVRK